MKTGKSRPLKYLGVSAPATVSFYHYEDIPTTQDYGKFKLGDLWLNQDIVNPFLWSLLDYEGVASNEIFHPAYTDVHGVYHAAWIEKTLAGTALWAELYPQDVDPENFPTDDGEAIANPDGVLQLKGKLYNFRTRGVGNLATIEPDDNVIIENNLTVGNLGLGFVRADANLLSHVTDGVAGETLIGSDVGVPIWNQIQPGDASFTVTPGDNTLDLTCVVPVVFGQIDTDSGSATPDGAGKINIFGGSNLKTEAATNVISNLTEDDITLVGGFTSNDITTTGNATVGNNLNLSSLGLGVLQSDAAGVVTSSTGSDGKILIASDTGSPQWKHIQSSDGSVIRLFGPNSVYLDVVAPGSFTTIQSDVGTAVATNNMLFITGEACQFETTALGDELFVNLEDDPIIQNSLSVTGLQGTVHASGTGTFQATQGTDLQFLNGHTGAMHDWLTPVTEDASMPIVAGTVAGTLNFQAIIAPPPTPPDLLTLSADDGNTATPVLGVAEIKGGDNINTHGYGHNLKVNLNKSTDQPTTNYDYTEGMYFLNDKPFLHNWAWRRWSCNPYTIEAGDRCGYVGAGAGSYGFLADPPSSYTLYPNSGMIPSENIGIGSMALGYQLRYTPPRPGGGTGTYYYHTHQGAYNSALGSGSLRKSGAGEYSLGIGYICGWNIPTSNFLGIKYGNGYLTDNTTAIGNCGASLSPQTKCSIAGIYDGGLLDTTRTYPVMVDQYSQLGVNYIAPHYDIEDGNLLIGYYASANTHGMRSVANPTYGANWGKVTSNDNTVTVTPGAGTLDLTEKTYAFSAYQAVTILNVTGNGDPYTLGKEGAMTEVFDEGNCFYPGDGVGGAAYFQAPITGSYFITIAIVLHGLNVEATINALSVYGSPDHGTLYWKNMIGYTNAITDFVCEQAIFCSGIAKLEQGDKFFFHARACIDGYGKTVGIQGPDTQVSGFLICKE